MRLLHNAGNIERPPRIRLMSLEMEGPFVLCIVVALAGIVVTRADAEVSMSAMSTFGTDYLRVDDAGRAAATDALRVGGYTVTVDAAP